LTTKTDNNNRNFYIQRKAGKRPSKYSMEGATLQEIRTNNSTHQRKVSVLDLSAKSHSLFIPTTNATAFGL
jgi:hypothetical protein